MLVERVGMVVGVHYNLKTLNFEMGHCMLKVPVVNIVAGKIHHLTATVGCCWMLMLSWNLNKMDLSKS